VYVDNARTKLCGKSAYVAALGLCMLLACGDDSGSSPNAPMKIGEPCFSPRGVDVGCVCSLDQKLGSRICQDDLTWTECRCPPGPAEGCTPGQSVLCSPCPGATKPWESLCLQGGTMDCTCLHDAGSMVGGTGGTGGSMSDAGDSGPAESDAGNDSDGG
jgi:hypothetical protein